MSSIPTFFKSLAEAANVLDVDREWQRFLQVTKIAEDDLNAGKRWSAWCARAAKKPDPTKETSVSPQTAAAHERSKTFFEEQRRWEREAATLEEAHAFAASILARLDALGRRGSPT